MRHRHFPRLCRSCQAPMACQEGACWRCGGQWAAEEAPAATLRAIAGGQLRRPFAELVQAALTARVDDDRWINDGGSVGSEPAGTMLRAVAAGR